MASGITQALPLAVGQIVNQQQQVNPVRDAQTVSHTQKDAQQITQTLSSQTATKVQRDDKSRSAQVPKKSEGSFSSQEERNEEDLPQVKKKGSGKSGSSLTVVA